MANLKILVDSCYWIALYTPEKVALHQRALALVDDLENNDIIIPWPTLYEFVNTRLAKRKENLFAFQKQLLKPNVKLVSDEMYKQSALTQVFELNKTRINSISLIDETLRQMILDINLKIDFLVTFNASDFEYPCQIRRIEILE